MVKTFHAKQIETVWGVWNSQTQMFVRNARTASFLTYSTEKAAARAARKMIRKERSLPPLIPTVKPISGQDRTLYAAGGPNEKNDCAVRGTAVATGRPYDEVHTLFARFGRKSRHGTSGYVTERVLTQLCNSNRIWTHERLSLARFVATHQVGRYVVNVRGHILAVVDGVIHDWFHWSGGTRRIVISFWKV